LERWFQRPASRPPGGGDQNAITTLKEQLDDHAAVQNHWCPNLTNRQPLRSQFVGDREQLSFIFRECVESLRDQVIACQSEVTRIGMPDLAVGWRPACGGQGIGRSAWRQLRLEQDIGDPVQMSRAVHGFGARVSFSISDRARRLGTGASSEGRRSAESSEGTGEPGKHSVRRIDSFYWRARRADASPA
jgi:hypothetical protein